MGVRDQLFGTIPFWDHRTWVLGLFRLELLGPWVFGTPQFGTMRVWDHGWDLSVFGTTVWNHACLGPRVFETNWTMEPAVWAGCLGSLGLGPWLFGTMGVRTTVWDHGCHNLGPCVWDQLCGPAVWDHGCLGPLFGTIPFGTMVWDHACLAIVNNRLGPPFGTRRVYDPQFGTMRVWDHGLGPSFGIMGV